MPRVYTYTRSATEERLPDPQPDAALTGWLARYPNMQVLGAFSDRGVSGLTPFEARPGGAALLAALRQQPADIVLVPAWHHAARDRGLRMQLRRDLSALGARLLSSVSLPDDGLEEEAVVRAVMAALHTPARARKPRRSRTPTR